MRINVRPSTARRDQSIFRNHLAPAFGDRPIDEIDFRAAQRFVADLAAGGLAPRTVRKAAGLLAQALAMPPVPHKDPTFLTPEEVARIADAIDPRYRTFVLVGAYAGLRHGELAALRAGRVDPVASTIEVVATRTAGSDGAPTFGPPKSRAGLRIVPVPRFVMDELIAHIGASDLGLDDLVWTTPAGAPLVESNFRRRVWKPATIAAGLPGLRIHDLRHTCVALWSRSLASPRAAAKWAGHSNPALVLTVYGGVFDDESIGVMDRLTTYANAPT